MQERGDLVPPSTIDGTFRPRRAAAVAFTELDGEIVLYDEATGGTHLLSPTASVLWTCFDGDVSLDDLAADVAEVYEIDADVAAHDVLAAARALGELGVLEGVRATVPAPSPPDVPEDRGGDDDCD